MKNRVHRTICFLFYFNAIFFLACSKEEHISSNTKCALLIEDCHQFPEFNVTFYSQGRYQYKAPFFNPNNPLEFLYYFKDNDLNIIEIQKYNLETKEKTTICEVNGIQGQPKWSSRGWIIWTSAPISYVEHIFVIKENGDSLTQVTSTLSNLYPTWSSDGRSMYWQYSPVLGHPYYFLKKDLLNNDKPDTILRKGDVYLGYAARSDVSINNELVCHTFIDNKNFIGIGDLNTKPLNLKGIINMETVFNVDAPLGLCWSASGNSIYISTINGLFNFDIIRSKKDCVMNFCDSKGYTYISTSSDSKFLIGERIDRHLALDQEGNFTGEIVENSSIYLIDLAKNLEIKVNI